MKHKNNKVKEKIQLKSINYKQLYFVESIGGYRNKQMNSKDLERDNKYHLISIQFCS